MKIFLPYRGEFGHLIMWHAPIINAYKEEKIVCCERGQEALFQNVKEYYFVNPRPEDKNKTEKSHESDKDLFDKIKKDLKLRFPEADFIIPEGQKSKSKKEYIIYQPYFKQNINVDVVICPRKRVLAPGRNWKYWTQLTKQLQSEGLSVFAIGSPTASFDVPCPKAWDYDRFFDASLEAILNSNLVVCTDSGLAHLTVQCGKQILMITHKGQPGPGSNWQVKWWRYQEENHLGIELNSVDSWNDLNLVVDSAKSILSSEQNKKKEIITKMPKKALNIGCGKDIKFNDNGYIWTNVDSRNLNEKVKNVDVFKKLPYKDGEFDYIYASDILEHHSYRRTEEVLREWTRVLKCGGDIYIQVPCLTTIINKFNSGKINENRLIELLFGGQNYLGDDWIFNAHYNCFSENKIRELAKLLKLKVKSIKKSGNNLNIILQK